MRTPETDHASLQCELNQLEKKYSWDDAPATVKRRMRTIKNRLSAKKSRDQAREYVEKLEKSVRLLSAESDALAQRLAIVEAENKILRQFGQQHSARHGHDAAAQHSDDNNDNANNANDDGAANLAAAARGEGGQEEPAVPSKPSLQLDALLLLLQTVAASREACPTSTPGATPDGGLQQSTSACAPCLPTSRLLELRATLSRHLTPRRLLKSTLRSGAGQSAAYRAARSVARRARLLQGPRMTRTLQRRDSLGPLPATSVPPS
jgi:hypothetical protein